MALKGTHLILIVLGLDLIQTKHLLIETVDKVETNAEVGADYKVGNDYKVRRITRHVEGHDQVFSNMYIKFIL